MGFFDALMGGHPLMAKAQVVISAGQTKRREDTRAVLVKYFGGPMPDATLEAVLAAASHGTVIREIGKATGVDLLRTLADKLEAKTGEAAKSG